MPWATVREGVDVEAAVGLVEHREVRLHHRHLQDLVALLLAAREALVEVALLETVVHPEALRPLHERQAYLQDREVRDALADGEGLAEEVEDAHPGDLLRVLEPEEDAPGGPLVGGQPGDVLAPEADRALGHPVRRVGQEGVGERGLPGAVGPHQGVDLALADRQAQPAEDLGAVDGDVEVLDLQQRGSVHALDCISTTAVVETRIRATGVGSAGQSARSRALTTCSGVSRTRSSPGTPLRSPYSAARSSPM